jgi:hypothetical protein
MTPTAPPRCRFCHLAFGTASARDHHEEKCDLRDDTDVALSSPSKASAGEHGGDNGASASGVGEVTRPAAPLSESDTDPGEAGPASRSAVAS